jgi:hypothetical protein
VGRHLRNLARLPNVEVHGFDQSPTMVAQCLRWTDQAWIDGHVRIGPPVGTLPYPDGEFDLVYTSEVLVHVRPEHLEGVLHELLRVARGQVFHFEPAPGVAVSAKAHDGCWNHDLVGAYTRLDRTCEMLPPGFRVQAPYRVLLGETSPWTWPPLLLELMRRLDADLEAGFAALRSEVEAAREQAAHAARVAESLAGMERDLAKAREAERRQAHAAELSGAMLSAKVGELAAVTREASLLREKFGELTRRMDEAERRAESLRKELATAHARESTVLATRLESEKAALSREIERLREELGREAASWRSRAAEVEIALQEARIENIRQRGRADHLAREQQEFVAAANSIFTRRTGGAP